MFYDQDVYKIENVFKLGLKLQSFLVIDPVDGDLQMQEYLFPVVSTIATMEYSGPSAASHKPQNFVNSSVAYLRKYTNASYNDVLKQEWQVRYRVLSPCDLRCILQIFPFPFS